VVALAGAGCGSAATAVPTVPAAPAATTAGVATGMSTPAVTGTPALTSTPKPLTIGQPADDGARIIAVESPTAIQRRVWVLPGAPGCPADASPGCNLDLGAPIPTTRIRDLTIDSPAAGITKVRLMLPRSFDAKPTARWPMLFLYRGDGGDFSRWTELQDVMSLAGPSDLLVVMPEGENDGTSRWDTYHLVELQQLLERNWQAADRRGVAGMSAGGWEAIHEAEAAPAMVKFAGSFSGDIDTTIAGYSIADEARLKGTTLYVAYGNGELGPLDNGRPSSYDETGEAERWCAANGAEFVKRLAALEIPVTVDAYGNGTHSPPYWQRDLERSFPLILAALGL
jgi:diacylglycerol O-acyltransferase/trehalose O-mycolyltransferase